MKIKKGLGLVLVLSLIIFMVGCNEPTGEPDQVPDALVLKSYKVPERLANEIAGILHNLLFYSEPKIGRATLTPDGQLLIVAPKSFHDGVEDFIEQIKKDNPEPSPPVEVNYWIVAGRKAKNPIKLDEFNEIKPALETIQNNQGNMEFKLLDHVAVTSSSQGTSTTLEGAVVGINQWVSAFSDGSLVIHPRIRLTYEKVAIHTQQSIDTTIETKSGELVVLGQLSQAFWALPIFEPEKEGETHYEIVNVYYIISADVKK